MTTKINITNFAKLEKVDEENLRYKKKELESMRNGVIWEVIFRSIYKRLSSRTKL